MECGMVFICDSDGLVEYNFFIDVPGPTYTGYAYSPSGNIMDEENFLFNYGELQTSGSVFDPSAYYNCTPSYQVVLPIILLKFIGSGKTGLPAIVEDKYCFQTIVINNISLSQNYFNPLNLPGGIFFIT